jgi:hypothetical protein
MAPRVGDRVEVFWRGENEWFPGVVDKISEAKGVHVMYEDGEEEWIMWTELDKLGEKLMRRHAMTKKRNFSDCLQSFYEGSCSYNVKKASDLHHRRSGVPGFDSVYCACSQRGCYYIAKGTRNLRRHLANVHNV